MQTEVQQRATRWQAMRLVLTSIPTALTCFPLWPTEEHYRRNITGELDCQGFNENAKDSIGAFSVKTRGRTESGYSDRATYSRVRTFDANANTENYGNPMAGHAAGQDIHPYSIGLTPLIAV